jgi:hypothetical protein
MTEHEEWIPEYLEFCELMKQTRSHRDQIIFIAGMLGGIFNFSKKKVGQDENV